MYGGRKVIQGKAYSCCATAVDHVMRGASLGVREVYRNVRRGVVGSCRVSCVLARKS